MVNTGDVQVVGLVPLGGLTVYLSFLRTVHTSAVLMCNTYTISYGLYVKHANAIMLT